MSPDSKLTLTLRFSGASPDEGSRAVELALPARFADRFVITGELGRGGMGVVFAAHDRQLGRAVAIKILTHGSEDAVARFLREGRLMANLSHPNIVPALDLDVMDGHPCLVSELMAGGSLADLLAKQGKLDARRVAELMAPVLDGLQMCHAAGIVHRDLKPANILLTGDGTPKLADLGLARSLTDEQGLTATGSVVGTPRYLAPELVRGDLPAPAGDIYAAGTVLYELLAGGGPFDGGSLPELLSAIANRTPPDVRDAAPDTPERLARLVARCLEKDPASRPGSAAAVREELLATLAPALPAASDDTSAPDRTAAAGRTPAPVRGPGSARTPTPGVRAARGPASPLGPAVSPDAAPGLSGKSLRAAMTAASVIGIALAALLLVARAPRTDTASASVPPSPAAIAGPAPAGAGTEDPRHAAIEGEIEALWEVVSGWSERYSRATAMVRQVDGDPGACGEVLDALARDIGAASPRLARLAAAVRELDEPAPAADSPVARVLRARAATVAFLIGARQHRARELHRHVIRLETTLQAGDAFMAAEVAPYPPALAGHLRRALAEYPAALDVAAGDPSRHARAVGRLLQELRRMAHWVHLSTPAAIGGAGEAALTRFESTLASRAGQKGGLLHSIALGITVFERDEKRDRPDLHGLERTLANLERLEREAPAVQPHVAELAAIMRDSLASYRTRQKPPATSQKPAGPK